MRGPGAHSSLHLQGRPTSCLVRGSRARGCGEFWRDGCWVGGGFTAIFLLPLTLCKAKNAQTVLRRRKLAHYRSGPRPVSLGICCKCSCVILLQFTCSGNTGGAACAGGALRPRMRSAVRSALPPGGTEAVGGRRLCPGQVPPGSPSPVMVGGGPRAPDTLCAPSSGCPCAPARPRPHGGSALTRVGSAVLGGGRGGDMAFRTRW